MEDQTDINNGNITWKGLCATGKKSVEHSRNSEIEETSYCKGGREYFIEMMTFGLFGCIFSEWTSNMKIISMHARHGDKNNSWK